MLTAPGSPVALHSLDENPAIHLGRVLGRVVWACASRPVEGLAAADAAVAALVGRAYSTILRIETGGMSRRIFSSVPGTYPVGMPKPLAGGAWSRRSVVDGEVFVAASPEEIAAHYPDPDVVAELGARSLINVPVLGAESRPVALFNIGTKSPYTAAELGTVFMVAQLLGPAIAAF